MFRDFPARPYLPGAAAYARAFDQAGMPDPAIASFRAIRRHAEFLRNNDDALFPAGTHKRLGDLYEAKGDRAKAASYGATFVDLWKFVELWKSADPDLQPKVARGHDATPNRDVAVKVLRSGFR